MTYEQRVEEWLGLSDAAKARRAEQRAIREAEVHESVQREMHGVLTEAERQERQQWRSEYFQAVQEWIAPAPYPGRKVEPATAEKEQHEHEQHN